MSISSSETEVQNGSSGSKRPPDLQNTKINSWILASDSVLLTGGIRMEPLCEICEYIKYGSFFLLWRCDPTRVMASSFLMFLDHTQRRSTVGRTPLDEWSTRRRDLYLTTHNTYNRQTSMPPVGFEPTISAGERPQTYALDRAATGTGKIWECLV